MAEHGPLATKYIDLMAAAFASGDPLETDFIAPDCEWHMTAGVLSGQEAIRAAFMGIRGAGWVAHDVVASQESGRVLTILAVNRFSDGSEHPVGAALLANDTGQICSMKSVTTKTY